MSHSYVKFNIKMPPSTSATTTSPRSSNPGRLQSISRMDGVPLVNRQRSLWAKRSRPSLQACLKVVDLYEILIAFTPKFSNRKSLTYLSCSVYKKALIPPILFPSTQFPIYFPFQHTFLYIQNPYLQPKQTLFGRI